MGSLSIRGGQDENVTLSLLYSNKGKKREVREGVIREKREIY